MAVRNVDGWIPIPLDSTPIGTVVTESAVVSVGRLKNLTSDTQEIPALLGADVGGGPDLDEDSNDAIKRTVYTYLYNGKQSIEETDVEDAVSDPFAAYSYEWLNRFNRGYDNACLGVSGARSATITDYRPYTSVYRALRNNDTDTGYTGDANRVAGAATYANLSSVMGKVETGDFYEDGAMVWLANPAGKESLRGLVDDQHRPIFIDGNNVAQDTLFGKPVKWTRGARVSTTFKMTAVGNPLFIFVNRNYLVHGARVAPQSRFIPASQNPTALVHIMQHRARKGFSLTIPQAAGLLEVTS